MDLLLLTARGQREDLVAGLASGADDFISKPFDPTELHARLRAGLRILQLPTSLSERVRQLEAALSSVKQLQGLLPMCAWCKNIRDDRNYWQQVDDYIAAHSEVRFTHGICPDCYGNIIEPELKALRTGVGSVG